MNGSPGDPALEFCLAMGVLTVIARQVPGELAAERQHWAEFITKLHEQTVALAQAQNKKATDAASALTVADAKMRNTALLIESKANEIAGAIYRATDGIDADEIAQKVAAKFEEAVVKPVQEGAKSAAAAADQLCRMRLGIHGYAWFWMFATAIFIAAIIFFRSWNALTESYDKKLSDQMAEFQTTARINDDTVRLLNIVGRPVKLTSIPGGGYQLVIDGADDGFRTEDGKGVINFRPRR